jgi:hypothetical protein
MNQNDMDRYLWRTGRRWSGDHRPATVPFDKTKLSGWTVFLLSVTFLVTLVGLILLR